jgi:hypothetical protein
MKRVNIGSTHLIYKNDSFDPYKQIIMGIILNERQINEINRSLDESKTWAYKLDLVDLHPVEKWSCATKTLSCVRVI